MENFIFHDFPAIKSSIVSLDSDSCIVSNEHGHRFQYKTLR